MNKNKKVSEIFNYAKSLVKFDKIRQAIEFLKNEIKKNDIKDNPELYILETYLGILLKANGQFREAIPILEKQINQGNKSEYLYFSLYLAYVELKEYDKAIEIISSYLDRYPADILKIPLEELLYDLKNGYATAYKDKILSYAKKNKIKIPNELLNDKNNL